jgi:hypothetical protein
VSYLGTPDPLFLNSRRSGLKKTGGGLYLTTPFKKTGVRFKKKGVAGVLRFKEWLTKRVIPRVSH